MKSKELREHLDGIRRNLDALACLYEDALNGNGTDELQAREFHMDALQHLVDLDLYVLDVEADELMKPKKPKGGRPPVGSESEAADG